MGATQRVAGCGLTVLGRVAKMPMFLKLTKDVSVWLDRARLFANIKLMGKVMSAEGNTGAGLLASSWGGIV